MRKIWKKFQKTRKKYKERDLLKRISSELRISMRKEVLFVRETEKVPGYVDWTEREIEESRKFFRFLWQEKEKSLDRMQNWLCSNWNTCILSLVKNKVEVETVVGEQEKERRDSAYSDESNIFGGI